MYAFGASLIIFIYWWITGYAVLATLYTKRNTLQNMLLAPAVGIATTTLLTFIFSYAGLPVLKFAHILVFFIILFSIILLLYKRPLLLAKQYYIFAIILLISLLVLGWPLFEFGFNWLSVTNDDMTNYCLSALRLMHNGYSTVPSLALMSHGNDYSAYIWFLNIGGKIRAGADLLLALTSSVWGMKPINIFMPLMIAINASLVSSLGGLVYKNRANKKQAIVSCLLLSFSALNGLGVIDQLIAQVVGITLLIAIFTILLRTIKIVNIKQLISYGLLVAILVSGLALIYPEVFPFLGLTFIVYTILVAAKEKSFDKDSFYVLLVAGAFTLIFINSYILDFISTLLFQLKHGFASSNISLSLFPYFFVPTGLSDLWGFQGFAEFGSPSLWISLTIVLSIGLTILALVFSTYLAFKRNVPAIVTLIMLLLGLFMYHNANDFGLFKLSLYIQPFLLATIVTGWFQLTNNKYLSLALFFFLAICNFNTLSFYLSTGRGQGIVDVPNGASGQITNQFNKLIEHTSPNQVIISDAYSIVLAKLQAICARNHVVYFPSKLFFNYTSYANLTFFAHNLWDNFFNTYIQQLSFNLHGQYKNMPVMTFFKENYKLSDNAILIADTAKQTNFNNTNDVLLKSNDNFVKMNLSAVKNHLIFISSNLGQHYYLPDSGNVSVNQQENDYFYPGKKFTSIGRYLLFQVINPSESMRMLLNISDTMQSDGQNKLPSADVIGAKRQIFPLVGRGSARVFSPLIMPQQIAGSWYLVLDMGRDGKLYSNNNKGLASLYGKDVHLGHRQIVAYARNISLVSEQDYQSLKPPVSLQNFPADLANPNLEYSGIYEDGYLSEDSFVTLTQPDNQSLLLIKGMMPAVLANEQDNAIIILADGHKLIERKLKPGAFVLKVPTDLAPGKHHISMLFTRSYPVSIDDKRPVSARLEFVGFVK